MLVYDTEVQQETMRFECESRTHVGLRREINEDSIFVDSDRGLWAIADGMGGHEAGEVASNMVIEALRFLPDTSDVDQLIDVAVDSVRRINGELIDLAEGNGREQSIGTTVVGLAIADGSYRCFWLGDSRAYRIRDGEIAQVTRDHRLVQDLVEAGMLTPEEAETHENANLLTRAVGVATDCKVDIRQGDARIGDRFLLASDGLTGVVGDHEIAATLQHRPLTDAADELIETVLARGAPDNVSLIILSLV